MEFSVFDPFCRLAGPMKPTPSARQSLTKVFTFTSHFSSLLLLTSFFHIMTQNCANFSTDFFSFVAGTPKFIDAKISTNKIC